MAREKHEMRSDCEVSKLIEVIDVVGQQRSESQGEAMRREDGSGSSRGAGGERRGC